MTRLRTATSTCHGMTTTPDTLARVRRMCLALPETSERLSHGAPTFFVGKKTFVTYMGHHHGDGRLALWCAAPPGLQHLLVAEDPARFFVPPYVGHRGGLGVRLDRRLGWGEVEGVIERAYAAVAPHRLGAAAGIQGAT